MKLCPHCGKELQDDALACQYCGNSVSTEPSSSMEMDDVYKAANTALTCAIIGTFCFGIILGPVAINKAKKAKTVLHPGDPLYGNANAGEIIGWVDIALMVIQVLYFFVSLFGGFLD